MYQTISLTELLKDFSESELRNFLGWAPGSEMVSVYVNLSGEHMKKCCYGRYGIEEQEKNEPKFNRCPRCKSITAPKSRFCDICGLPLSNVEIDHEIDHNVVMKEMSLILAKYSDVLPEVLAKAQRC